MQALLSVSLATAAIVLLAAGTSKVLRPASTIGALRAMHLPASAAVVRAIGLTEMAAGLVAVLADAWVGPASVATVYAAFVLFVAAALRRGTYLQTCGCFGGLEVPPTRIHLVVDATAVVVPVLATVTRSAPLVDLLAGEPLAGIPLLVVIATAAFLVVAIITVLPMAVLAMTAERSARVAP